MIIKNIIILSIFIFFNKNYQIIKIYIFLYYFHKMQININIKSFYENFINYHFF